MEFPRDVMWRIVAKLDIDSRRNVGVYTKLRVPADLESKIAARYQNVARALAEGGGFSQIIGCSGSSHYFSPSKGLYSYTYIRNGTSEMACLHTGKIYSTLYLSILD